MNDSHFMNLGYACINMTLSNVKPKKDAVTTNRSMIRRTFLEKGIKYAGELALKNALDLKKILEWNEKNNIKVFRISSEMVPWASEYKLKNLPTYRQFAKALQDAGKYAINHGHRLSFHPGPFNKLASSNEKVLSNTIRDLEIHGELFDLMGMPRSPWSKINIHVGAAYNDKVKALDTFCKNYERLPEGVKTRLTVENDDKASLYSTHELFEGVYKRIGIPIVFDFHHHKFCSSGQSEKEALELAMKTWGDIKPTTHYSETKRNADGTDYYRPQAHSDLIFNKINDYGYDIHIMIEAKHKEKALLRYRNDWNKVAVFSNKD